ncbi:MAG: TrkA family potassium uptake protein [Candidatus Binatia bacterium]
MTSNVLIVGGGEVGTYLARLLVANKQQVKILEVRPEELPRLRRDVPADIVTIGDGADPAVLEAADVRHVQVVAAVTGTDATNLVVTSLARFEFQVPRTIARVHTPKHAWLFTPELGVDMMINQADLMAHLIAEEMVLGNQRKDL